MLLLQKPRGQRGNNFSEIELHRTSGLQIIVQSFISSHFSRVSNFSWKNPGHSIIRENLLLYLKEGRQKMLTVEYRTEPSKTKQKLRNNQSKQHHHLQFTY